MRYPALIEGEKGGYGIFFPDLDGVVAMGETIDEAIANATEALADAAQAAKEEGGFLPLPSAPEDIQVPEGMTLTTIPLLQLTGKPRRANLTIDEGVLTFIDSEARRRGMTRKAYIEWMTRVIAKHVA